jgi:predicted MFS family arabinose efflux permease
LVLGGSGSAQLWLALGGLGAVLALLVQQLWPQSLQTPVRRAAFTASARLPRGSTKLILCYGCFGFGYILPATYLPALSRTLIDDPRVFGLAWPVFGVAAAISTLLASRALRRWRLLEVWSGCHLLMAIGVVLPLFSHSGFAIAMAALLVGGTFMVATMTGLQRARQLVPSDPAPLLGRMTAAFAIGQIAGPLVALMLSRVPFGGWSGIEATLVVAAILLCASALWLRYSSIKLETPSERSTYPTGD